MHILIALFSFWLVFATSCSKEPAKEPVDEKSSKPSANQPAEAPQPVAEKKPGTETEENTEPHVLDDEKMIDEDFDEGDESLATNDQDEVLSPIDEVTDEEVKDVLSQQSSDEDDHNAPASQTTVITQPYEPPESKMITELATLTWVGFDYREKLGQVKVEIVSVGKPNYDFFQEFNAAKQPELVVRLYRTKPKKRLLRDINASEFLSPVAFIRLRPDPVEHFVDIILTLRDAVKPKLFAHNGNLLLTFPIPDRYYGNQDIGDAPNSKAVELNTKDITPILLVGSQQPSAVVKKVNMPDVTKGAFKDAPKDGGIPIDIVAQPTKIEKNQIAPSPAPEAANVAPEKNSQIIEENKVNNTQELNSNPQQNTEPSNNNPENLQTPKPTEPNNDEAILESFSVLSVAAAEPTAERKPEEAKAPEEDFENSDMVMDDNEGKKRETVEEKKDNHEDKLDELDVFSDAKTAEKEVTVHNKTTEDINALNQQSTHLDLTAKTTQGQESETTEESSVFQPVSLEFKGATLREVIRAFAAENGTNFTFKEDIGDTKVSLNLKNVPWDQALQSVLETNSLGMTKLKGNVIRIDKLTALEDEKKSLESVRKKSQLLIPTKVLVVRLSYSDAEKLETIIKEMLPSASFDERTKVKSDKRTNSVVVEAIPQEIEKIKALIERIDLQTPQVKISTRVIEVLKTSSNFFGINWGAPLRMDQGRGLGFGSLVFPNNMSSAFSVDTGARVAENGGRFDTYLGSINNSVELDIRLRMTEQLNYTKSLQNNSVIVLDNQKARIEAGQVDSFPIPAGGGQNTLSEVSFLLVLEVTPHITADGSVQMQIIVENSSPTKSNNLVSASKNVRKLETHMIRSSGETAVIGGLYTTQMRETAQGMPFFSKIPILGALFKSKGISEDRRELIIMVTPVILTSERVTDTNRKIANFQNEKVEMPTEVLQNPNSLPENFNNLQGQESNQQQQQQLDQMEQTGDDHEDGDVATSSKPTILDEDAAATDKTSTPPSSSENSEEKTEKKEKLSKNSVEEKPL